jgi:hypothetical protein
MREAAPLGVWLLVLSVYYAFATTDGTFGLLHWHTDYYDLLAEGFRNGHLYIPIVPKAKLLAKANPFAGRWIDRWMWDASLFDGRYYIYWGPTPSILLWLWKVITRIDGKVFDQWLTLIFMLGRLYAFAALIWTYARRSGQLPRWAVLLVIIVFGVASPTPYFLARPLIYETSIAAGQCFIFCGLLAAYRGLLAPLTRLRWFILAGTCWALAMGSRGSQLLAAPLLVLLTAYVAMRPRRFERREVLRVLFALGTPVAVGLLAYAIYNYERFGSVKEFGLKYQLTSRPFGNKARFLLPNIVSYLSNKIAWSCEFPFVRLPMEREMSTLIRWPDDYDIGDYEKGERAAGILLATTVCWLLWLWLWRGVRALRELLRGRKPRMSDAELLFGGAGVAMVLTMAPAARMWMANMRFLQDGIGGLLLLTTLAVFWMLRRTRGSGLAPLRTTFNVVFVGLALHTITTGVLLGFTGHMDNFEEENPHLFSRLSDEFSLCGDD